MAKAYSVQFGSGDPRQFTGLNATLALFFRIDTGATLSPPGISEALSGSGVYWFSYGTTTPIAFLADAATTSPGAAGRYVLGQIDPADRSDEYGNTLVAIGNSLTQSQINLGSTLVGIGNTSIAYGGSIYASVQNIGLTLTGSVGGIGTTASIIGDQNTNPGDLFGYLKRISELIQGQEQFIKGAGTLTMFDRTGATTLAVRTITNNASLVIKS